MLDKKLDEEVAASHLDALGVKLTKMSKEQSEYLGILIFRFSVKSISWKKIREIVFTEKADQSEISKLCVVCNFLFIILSSFSGIPQEGPYKPDHYRY